MTPAFAVQSLTAVLAGGLLSRLPRQPVLAATAVLFTVGSFSMLFGSGEAADSEGDEAPTGDPPSTRPSTRPSTPPPIPTCTEPLRVRYVPMAENLSASRVRPRGAPHA